MKPEDITPEYVALYQLCKCELASQAPFSDFGHFTDAHVQLNTKAYDAQQSMFGEDRIAFFHLTRTRDNRYAPGMYRLNCGLSRTALLWEDLDPLHYDI